VSGGGHGLEAGNRVHSLESLVDFETLNHSVCAFLETQVLEKDRLTLAAQNVECVALDNEFFHGSLFTLGVVLGVVEHVVQVVHLDKPLILGHSFLLTLKLNITESLHHLLLILALCLQDLGVQPDL